MKIVKRKKAFVAGILLLLFACVDQLSDPPPSETDGRVCNFDVSAARKHFEANAHDLVRLHFSRPPVTRSDEAGHPELIPEWEKAVFSFNDEVELVEVPIRTEGRLLSTTRSFKEGKNIMAKSLPVAMRLMVGRRTAGDTVMFVVTLVPSARYTQKPNESMAAFRYLGGKGNFTGKVFCSTLSGEFIEAAQYVGGRRAGLLNIMTGSRLQSQGVNLGQEPYETIRLAMIPDGGTGVIHSDECPLQGGMCSFHPQYPASACPFCLEEVVVRACPECGARLEEGETCNCRPVCEWCGSYPCHCESNCPQCRPFSCTKCRECGSHFCFGECRQEPGCPYNQCPGNPCTCCEICRGPCMCSGCHSFPCRCCPGMQCPDCGGYLDVTTRAAGCYPCSCPRCPFCKKRRCAEIHDDCSQGMTASRQLATDNHDILKTTASSTYGTRYYPSFDDYLAKIREQPDIEHSVSLKYYEDEEVYRLDEIISGTATGVEIRGASDGMVASIHSHPDANPSPPSGQDIITTAACAKENPRFRYLYTYAGDMHYVLYVEDRTKAAAFYEKYKNDVDPETNMFKDKTPLYIDLDDIRNVFSKLSETDSEIFKLAYLLDRHESGIRLLRKKAENSEFSLVHVRYCTDRQISPLECK